ncbi:hypothetical protein EV686_108135 [Paracandidimonas soli]|uniref:Uncharacterized protein n=1 Tax=Paracandidimonas soli TaxID=1917182 RepID=A0A4R3UVV0_9BURK|nr:hypothetical protein EV686_108135 [Paracandidimonas soli]
MASGSSGQAAHFDQQVFAQRTADTAVAHFHQLFVGTGKFGASLANQGGIDVDFGHVVDDDRHALSFSIVEDVIEQRGFARAEKAGENGDGQSRIS